MLAGCASSASSASFVSSASSEEESISRELASLSEAWSRGDAKGAASFYAEDGQRVDPGGDVEHGRAEVAAAYERVLHGRFSGAKFTLERGTFRWITPDVALWQGGLSIAPPGDLPVTKAYLLHVMKKDRGRWLILEAHAKLLTRVL